MTAESLYNWNEAYGWSVAPKTFMLVAFFPLD